MSRSFGVFLLAVALVASRASADCFCKGKCNFGDNSKDSSSDTVAATSFNRDECDVPSTGSATLPSAGEGSLCMTKETSTSWAWRCCKLEEGSSSMLCGAAGSEKFNFMKRAELMRGDSGSSSSSSTGSKKGGSGSSSSSTVKGGKISSIFSGGSSGEGTKTTPPSVRSSSVEGSTGTKSVLSAKKMFQSGSLSPSTTVEGGSSNSNSNSGGGSGGSSVLSRLKKLQQQPSSSSGQQGGKKKPAWQIELQEGKKREAQRLSAKAATLQRVYTDSSSSSHIADFVAGPLTATKLSSEAGKKITIALYRSDQRAVYPDSSVVTGEGDERPASRSSGKIASSDGKFFIAANGGMCPRNSLARDLLEQFVAAHDGDRTSVDRYRQVLDAHAATTNKAFASYVDTPNSVMSGRFYELVFKVKVLNADQLQLDGDVDGVPTWILRNRDVAGGGVEWTATGCIPLEYIKREWSAKDEEFKPVDHSRKTDAPAASSNHDTKKYDFAIFAAHSHEPEKAVKSSSGSDSVVDNTSGTSTEGSESDGQKKL